jgi:hypothetical protein
MTQVDFLGDPMPEGYTRWSCPDCNAICTFEAMNMCVSKGSGVKCPYSFENVEANGGLFGFMIKEKEMKTNIDEQTTTILYTGQMGTNFYDFVKEVMENPNNKNYAFVLVQFNGWTIKIEPRDTITSVCEKYDKARAN